MDVRVSVNEISKLRAKLKENGLTRNEMREALIALVKANVTSLEDLAKFGRLDDLDLSPRIRAVLRKITPESTSFDLKTTFLTLGVFDADPVVCSRVSAVLKEKLSIDSWASFLEIRRSDLEMTDLSWDQVAALLEVINFARNAEYSRMNFQLEQIRQKIGELKAMYRGAHRDLSRLQLMSSLGISFPACSHREVKSLSKSYEDCGYELKDLTKSHVERESLEKEVALEKELTEYEKQLPPLVTNNKTDPINANKATTTTLELGNANTTFRAQSDSMKIEDQIKDRKYYREITESTEHTTFVYNDPATGPLVAVVTVVNPKTNPSDKSKVLLRTKSSDRLLEAPPSDRSKEIATNLKSLVPASFADKKLHKVKDANFHEAMLKIEDQLVINKYKFGLLYVKAGQKNENAMYANEGGDPSYEEFLSFIGRTVTLKDFDGFSGGLDVSGGNRTGVTSLYEKFDQFEIMYHVSTLLPNHPSDEQKLERKRHLGNDMVVLVFLESDEDTFDPEWLTTQFTYVFVIVTEDKRLKAKTGHSYYRLAVASKVGVKSFGPVIPKPAIFRKTQKFKRFLLTKLINAERAAMHAETFARKTTDTRQKLFSYEIDKAAKD